MRQAIKITDPLSGASARIAPSLGFNCFEFTAKYGGRSIPVIDSPDNFLDGESRPNGYGIPLLFPFPNRIRNGLFSWNGREYRIPLPADKPHAIHGFCLDRPWRVIEKKKQHVVGQFQLSVDAPDRRECWPADFILDVRYRIAENRLETQFKITNPDTVPLPWGLGTHAYFKIPLGRDSAPRDCVIQVPITEKWELKECLPTGRRLPVEGPKTLKHGLRFGEVALDHAYTGWQSDGGTVRAVLIDEKAGIEVAQVCDSALFSHAVVYTPPGRNAVCMEPYTCVTDAINLETRELNTGLQVLAPGKTVQTWIAIQVGPVLA